MPNYQDILIFIERHTAIVSATLSLIAKFSASKWLMPTVETYATENYPDTWQTLQGADPINVFVLIWIAIYLGLKLLIEMRKPFEAEINLQATDFLLNDEEKPAGTVPLSEWTTGKAAQVENIEQRISFSLDNKSEIVDWLVDLSNRTDEYIVQKLMQGELRASFTLQANYFQKIADQVQAGYYEELHKLGKLIEAGNVLLPQSPVGQYILTHNKEEPRSRFALCYLTGIYFEPLHEAAGGTKLSTSINEQLMEYYNFELEDVSDPKRIQFFERTIPARAINDISLQAEEYRAKLDGHLNAAANQYLKFDTVLTRLAKAFQLTEATKRWKEDAIQNENRADKGLGLFILTAFFAIGSLLVLHFVVFEKFTTVDSTEVLVRLPVYSFTALFWIWLMKHFSRMYVESQKMASDARFRLALSQVYVDMKANKSLEDDRDKKLLETLFAPRVIDNKSTDVQPPIEQVIKIGDVSKASSVGKS